MLLGTLSLTKPNTPTLTAIRSWHGMYRDLREDRWCHACAELREAYRKRDAAPVWRRVLLYPYYLYTIDGLRKEVRIFLLRERFVAPPAAADGAPTRRSTVRSCSGKLTPL